MPGTKRALFVDWGGTLALTKDNRTVVDAAGHPVLMPNVAATLARKRPRFDVCFIVSNQARIARGEISADEVWKLCPHGDEDGCGCRKPRPGMFLELAGLHDVDLPASTHVGDSERDRDAAARAGVRTFVWARDFFGWTS